MHCSAMACVVRPSLERAEQPLTNSTMPRICNYMHYSIGGGFCQDSKIGCCCFPSKASARVWGIFVKSAIREVGFPVG